MRRRSQITQDTASSVPTMQRRARKSRRTFGARMNTTDRNSQRRVRIGGASGFWGDSVVGAPQLVHSGLIDYLVFDYLAETTMAILASARARKPAMGYATDFVDIAMKQVLG